MSLKNFGEEPYTSSYEKGYVRGKQFPHEALPKDAPGRYDKEYVQGYEDGLNDALLEEDEFSENEFFYQVLGSCVHGVDLDREFCPEGCVV